MHVIVLPGYWYVALLAIAAAKTSHSFGSTSAHESTYFDAVPAGDSVGDGEASSVMLGMADASDGSVEGAGPAQAASTNAATNPRMEAFDLFQAVCKSRNTSCFPFVIGP